MAGRGRPFGWGLIIGVAVLVAALAVPAPASADFTFGGRVTFGGVGRAGVTLTTNSCCETTTDATGAYTMDTIADGPDIYLRAEWQRRQDVPDLPHLSLTTIVDGVSGPYDFDFPPPATVTVHVREEDGTPVTGAVVRVRHDDPADVTAPGTVQSFLASGVETTDSSGDAHLVDIAGSADITVSRRANGFTRSVLLEDVTVETTGTSREVVLPTPVTVTGHAAIDGVRQAGLRVTVAAADGSSSASATTDASGAYSLPAVPGPSTFEVRGDVPAGDVDMTARAVSDVTVADGTVLDADLPHGEAITTSVVDTAGAPAFPVQVEVRNEDADATGLVMPGELVRLSSEDIDHGFESGDIRVGVYPGQVDAEASGVTSWHPIWSWLVWTRQTEQEDVTVAAGDEVELVLPALPGPPTDVSFELTGPAEATVTWEPPAADVGTPITGYQIVVGDFTFGPGTFEIYPPGLLELGPDARSAVIQLSKGVPTALSLHALTVAGGGADVAESVTAPLLLPGAPTDVSFTAVPGQATVTWSPPAVEPGLPITGYRVVEGVEGTFNQTTHEYGPDDRSAVLPVPNAKATPLRVYAVTDDGAGPAVRGSVLPRLPNRVDVRGADHPNAQLWGNDVYGLGANDQVLLTTLYRINQGAYLLSVQNDGADAQRMVVRDRSNAPFLRVRWFQGGRNVTAAVEAGRYRTPVLRPGQVHRLIARIAPVRSAPHDSVQVLELRASPAKRLVQQDKFTFWVRIP